MSERDIFTAAREMTDPAARSAYLDRACGGDAGTKARVEALLRAHDQPDSLLDHPAVSRPEPGYGPTQALSAPDAGRESSEPAEEEVPLGFLEPPTRPDAMGRIGHYEVLQVLGQGGFGIVFRAFDDVLHRVVAVKVLSPQMAATSPARKRFLREARSSAQVRHENVVQVHEVGEQPLPYIAMEFIPGETLQQRLDRVGPVEPAEVVRVGRQIAEGLAAAHACDLIHRDIKPGNVLLEGGAQRVKLTDFGLARAADDASISQSGLITGTPMYMAPEQAKGEKLDQRADLFSLGSVLYQMAAGRPPFRANGTVAVLKRVAEDTPRPIREVIPETPQWLCDIIAKLHAKNPDERYQSAREIADVLADCEAQLKAHARVKDFSRIPRGKPQRSGRWKWVAAAAVLLLPVMALAVTEFVGLTHWFRGTTLTADPNRKAAEYVLSIGGQVQVDGRDRNINAVADLPRDPFRLTWVGLKDSNQVSDTGLANFKECKNLTFLGLFDTSVSDEGLVNFQNCTRLTFLNLSRTKISDAGLANFKNCTELTTVVLNETEVSDAGLDYLKNSRQLTKLCLQKTKVTGAGIEEFKKASPLCKIEWDSGVSQPPPTFTNGIGMEFVIVPKGKSWLGGGKDKLGDKEVEIPADFYLGKYEVTQEEWEKVMGENPSCFSRAGDGKDAVKDIPDADLKRFPVENVSWDQCQIFVAKLNKLEKETGWVYRLPNEVEWEYACRGGPMVDKADSAFDFYFAKPTNTLSLEQANFLNERSDHLIGLSRTSKVGTYQPNILGLYDMHGNVWERCADTEKASDGTVLGLTRGGGYNGGPWDCVASRRGAPGESPSRRVSHLGLRLARVPAGAPSPEAKTPPLAVAPFTDADVQRIAALPAEQQVEEVRKELVRRNPGFDGKVEHKIEDGVVTEFRIVTDHVTDIAPIRVFNALRVLDCSGAWNNKPNGLLADLTPLGGMNLVALTHLNLDNTRVTDAGMVYFKDCKDLTHLSLERTLVTDAGLAQFKGCKALTFLAVGSANLSDAGLIHFKDCKALTVLWLYRTNVDDAGLAYFKDCKDLTDLSLASTKVSDVGLAHFKNCKNLTRLDVNDTQVGDAGLAHFKGMPLVWLRIDDTGVSDLTPLQGIPLEEIYLTPKNITRGLDILRDTKSLKSIGVEWDKAWPAAEFWQRYDKGEFSAAPLTDADVQRIAALPAEQQVEEVRKELMRRNPGFDGQMEHKIEDGVVTEFKIVTDQVTDIAPIRAFNGLRVLDLHGTYTDKPNGLLADLTALRGMNLAGLTHLGLGCTKVTDAGMVYFKDCKDLTALYLDGTKVSDKGLAHFKDCKNLASLRLDSTQVSDAGLMHFQDCKDLKYLNLSWTQVSDAGLARFGNCKSLTDLRLNHTRVDDAGLADFKGCTNLTCIDFSGTQVSDAGVAHFKGMPLTVLHIQDTGVTDLSPLQGMPLEDIRLTPKNITKGLDVLRDMKSLKTIGISWDQSWPAVEFWERYDKGEFTK